jgi:hypothetical protein
MQYGGTHRSVDDKRCAKVNHSAPEARREAARQ